MSQSLSSTFLNTALAAGSLYNPWGIDVFSKDGETAEPGGESVAAPASVSSEPAVQFIRDRILDGTYTPGSFLSSKALAKELNISRTPVRDALRILEAQGLVEITPRLGATVPRLSLEEVSDLIGLRCVFEAYCALLAAQRRSVHDLEIMDRAQEAMETVASKPFQPETYPDHLRTMAKHDYAFHWQIAQATRNRFILQEIERSRALLTVFVQPPRPEAKTVLMDVRSEVCRAHRAILEAIRTQEPESARRAMERHLSMPGSK